MYLNNVMVEYLMNMQSQNHYTKYDIQCLIVFSDVTTLLYSALNFNPLIINVGHKSTTTCPTTRSILHLSLLKILSYNQYQTQMRQHLPYYHVPSPFIIVNFFHIISLRHKCAITFPTTMSLLLLSLLIFFQILTNTKFVHVTFTYYHN